MEPILENKTTKYFLYLIIFAVTLPPLMFENFNTIVAKDRFLDGEEICFLKMNNLIPQHSFYVDKVGKVFHYFIQT